MTEFLNDIFFSVDNFNNEQMISLLEKYMFTKNLNCRRFENRQSPNQSSTTTILKDLLNQKEEIDTKISIPSISSQTILQNNNDQYNVVSIPNKTKNNNDIITPNKMDSLFWCIYIAVYGYSEYNTIKNHYSNKEMEERQKIIDYLKKNPALIKQSNIKITKIAFQEMLSDLMINKKITLNILILLCIYYNINVFIVNEYTYMEFSVINEILDKPTYIIYKNKNKEYAIDLDISVEKLNNIKNTYFKIESFEKPLKTISKYTTNELKEILKQLNLKDEMINNLKLKTDIYNFICDFCIKDINI